MASLILENLSGQKFAAEVHQYHEDRNSFITNFTLERCDGTSEHFLLAEAGKIDQVFVSFKEHLSSPAGSELHSKIGQLRATKDGLAESVVDAATKAVLEHFSGLSRAARFYYYDEHKRPCFYAPVVRQ